MSAHNAIESLNAAARLSRGGNILAIVDVQTGLEPGIDTGFVHGAILINVATSGIYVGFPMFLNAGTVAASDWKIVSTIP